MSQHTKEINGMERGSIPMTFHCLPPPSPLFKGQLTEKADGEINRSINACLHISFVSLCACRTFLDQGKTGERVSSRQKKAFRQNCPWGKEVLYSLSSWVLGCHCWMNTNRSLYGSASHRQYLEDQSWRLAMMHQPMCILHRYDISKCVFCVCVCMWELIENSRRRDFFGLRSVAVTKFVIYSSFANLPVSSMVVVD